MNPADTTTVTPAPAPPRWATWRRWSFSFALGVFTCGCVLVAIGAFNERSGQAGAGTLLACVGIVGVPAALFVRGSKGPAAPVPLDRWLLSPDVVSWILLTGWMTWWINSYVTLPVAIGNEHGEWSLVSWAGRVTVQGRSPKGSEPDSAPAKLGWRVLGVVAGENWRFLGARAQARVYTDVNSVTWEERSLGVPYWPVFVALCTGIAWRHGSIRTRERRVREGLCVNCGYDLRGSPERCPECGTIARQGRSVTS